jgi:branched-subunit amino acid aminotransferase/4-amino-4-deoxychorismate lyase
MLAGMLMGKSSLRSPMNEGKRPPMHDDTRESRRKTWTSRPATAGAPAVAASSRGLRYGDGVFVTLGIANGRLLDAARQLDRLRDAAHALGLRPPPPFDDANEAPWVLAAVLENLGADEATDGTARLQWSAVEGPRGFGRGEVDTEAIVDLGPAPAPRAPAVVVLESHEAPLPALPRWKTCSALAAVLCEGEARALGADTGIRTLDGILLEATSANLFWLRDGRLFTPGADLPLYAGSVRERTIECATDAGLPVEEGAWDVDELRGVEALLLTNAARGVELAVSVDGRALPEPPELALALADAVAARREANGIAFGGPDATA